MQNYSIVIGFAMPRSIRYLFPKLLSSYLSYSTAYTFLALKYFSANCTAYMVPFSGEDCATITFCERPICNLQRSTSLVGFALMSNGYSVIIAPPLFTTSSCRILLHLG